MLTLDVRKFNILNAGQLPTGLGAYTTFSFTKYREVFDLFVNSRSVPDEVLMTKEQFQVYLDTINPEKMHVHDMRGVTINGVIIRVP